MAKGLIQIYAGDGKGKTTAAFGQALRFIGHGGKVCVVQFMKGREYGECLAAKNLLVGKLVVHLAGLDSFVMRGAPAPVDVELAQAGLALARQAYGLDYGMLILDEINVALDFGLLNPTTIVDLLAAKPAAMELILTGRYAYPPIIALADTVTEVKEVRHHYQRGIKERAGMEF